MANFTNVPTPFVSQKADRLLRTRRVTKLGGGTWDVVGDTAMLFGMEHVRRVVNRGKTWTCTCPTRGLCSHIVACQRHGVKRAIRLTAADGTTTLVGAPSAPPPPQMTADELFAAFEL